jgi:alanine racemase
MPSHAISHARAWLEVDAGALVHNARVLRRAIPSDTGLGLLVKANGYGHGIEIAARAAIAGGADQLMVATLDEGLALRRAGFAEPILVVYPVPRDGVGEAVASDLEVSIAGVDPARRTLEGWAAARPAMTGDRRMRVHIEVDTGMGRGGVAPDELLGVIDAI